MSCDTFCAVVPMFVPVYDVDILHLGGDVGDVTPREVVPGLETLLQQADIEIKLRIMIY